MDICDVWLYDCNIFTFIVIAKGTEETFWCPQTFIVRFLIIDKRVPTAFYSEA